MRFIGVLGVLALLGLAWAISYHRREVRLRVVFWGVGLQFLFALIILREDVWSFIGMGLVAGLVAVYLLRQDRATPDRSYVSVTLLLSGAIAVAVVLGLIGAGLYLWTLVGGLVVHGLAVVLLVLWWRLLRQREALDTMADTVAGRGKGRRKKQ